MHARECSKGIWREGECAQDERHISFNNIHALHNLVREMADRGIAKWAIIHKPEEIYETVSQYLTAYYNVLSYYDQVVHGQLPFDYNSKIELNFILWYLFRVNVCATSVTYSEDLRYCGGVKLSRQFLVGPDDQCAQLLLRDTYY